MVQAHHGLPQTLAAYGFVAMLLVAIGLADFPLPDRCQNFAGACWNDFEGFVPAVSVQAEESRWRARALLDARYAGIAPLDSCWCDCTLGSASASYWFEDAGELPCGLE